ncbi:GGDEF domain-containing protein [Paractinoplanes atraurantiacus]|uniref:Diguanylate cyclase (GGDEF) domain-containing protein n=1 Tax=Paractinoplanes atraurantiacus TaxID=1036182 RepID=A0A285HAG2_9ACTN|nr:GGDEF domain-containing protein [Actinoplanes atraurantiacus]SNY32715.1 diguanylate cyclase (GGDEF) domain-containing protein [Actinoplanes atraurantiacus]
MREAAVRLPARNGFEEELTALVGAVYASHAGLADRARALEQRALAAGDRQYAALARLVVADVDNRGGRQNQGIKAAHAELSAAGDRLVVAKAHAVIAGGLWRLGDNAEAVKHAYEADRLLTEDDPLGLRVDHAVILAAQVNDQRLGRVSHEEYRVAQRLADRLGHPDLITANLNNWAWSCFRENDQPTARRLARQMQEHSARSGHPLNTSCADTVARVLMADGQISLATRILEDALAHAPSTDVDAVPACLITFAEIKRAEGDVPGALALLERCRELTRRDDVPEMDAIALQLLATCHADLGNFESAYREMVEFHQAWTVRRTEQSEALASVTQARFAIDEARRDRERFRELAERDALTGLWNRRRSDEHLAAALAAGVSPMSVAILDLDHFKRVNDTFSHEAGDSVLRRVGDMLRAIVEPHGHAARHGGEEFVLFLSLDPARALTICEQVRAAVAAYDWSGIAAGLRVTTSIGLTALRPGDDARTALARADAHLYAAKENGRDQVVA